MNVDLRALIETTIKSQAARFGLEVMTTGGLVVWSAPDEDSWLCGVRGGELLSVASFCPYGLRRLSAADAQAEIERVIKGIVESTAALSSPLVPDGAVCLERGSTFVRGSTEYVRPVCRIDRVARTYRRSDDTDDRPWPPIVVFVGAGGVPIVERAA